VDKIENYCSVEFKPKFQQPDSFCNDCCIGIFNTGFEIELHHQDFDALKAVQPNEKDAEYCISKEWFNHWKKKNPSFANSDCFLPRPDTSPYRDHVFCKHGNSTLEEKELWILISSEVFNF
jgi:hypothetical protein